MKRFLPWAAFVVGLVLISVLMPRFNAGQPIGNLIPEDRLDARRERIDEQQSIVRKTGRLTREPAERRHEQAGNQEHEDAERRLTRDEHIHRRPRRE